MPPPCPDENALLALVALQLSEQEADAVRQHLDGCDACRAAALLAAGSRHEPVLTVTAPGVGRAQSVLTLAPGTKVGRYRVERLVGAGGMGVVYAAWDEGLDRAVALKLLRHVGQSAAELEERLVRESRAMAKLAHPNVLSVYDIGSSEGRVFIAMEYVAGSTLGQWLRASRRSWREVLHTFRLAGAGLAAAHAAGFVHRDFKPDNVLLDAAGRVLVTDFGLARSVDSPEAEAGDLTSQRGEGVLVTRTGALLGTPAYMAPEQFAARNVDARADVFSFAVALWEALFGCRPFTGQTIGDIRAAIATGRPARPGQVRIPRWLERAVRRGLAEDPAARFQSMDAFLSALAPRRSRQAPAWAAAVLLAAAGGGVSAWRVWQADPCRGGPELEGVWDAARRDALKDAVLGSGAPDAAGVWGRLAEALDRQAAAWTEARGAICAQARTASAATRDARLECLDERREELDAVARLVPTLDGAQVANVSATLRFASPAACAVRSERALRQPVPQDPQLRGPVEEVRSQLKEIAALRNIGRYAEALQRLQALAGRARALGYAPLEAEVLYLLGLTQSNAGEALQARRTLLDAANLAEANHHDVTAAWCWFVLVTVAEQDLSDFAAAEEYIARAKTAIARIGGDTELEGRLLYHEGLHHVGRGRLDEAEKALVRAREMMQHIAPDEVPLLLEGLGLVYEDRGEFSRALQAHQQVLAVRTAKLGETHPDLFYTHTNIGSAHLMLGQLEEGLVHLQKGLTLLAASKGEDNIEYAQGLHNIAEVLRSMGRNDEALPILERAREIMIAKGGRTTPRLALILETTGGVYIGLGRIEDAVKTLAEALSIYTFAHGEKHVEVGKCRLNLGEALLLAKRPQEALEHQQQGLEIFLSELGDSHPHTAYAHAAVGKTLLTVGRARDATERLAAAVALYDKVESDAGQAADAMFHLARATDGPKGARSVALKWAREAERRWAASPTGWESQLGEVRRFIREREGRSR